MAGTVAVAAKARLVALLQALTGTGEDLAGVTVSYSYDGQLHAASREYVYAGKVSGPVKLATMSHGGRLARREDLALALHVLVATPGADSTADAEARAVEIGVVIEELVAGDPTLGDAVPGLLLVQVTRVELESAVDDDAAGAVLTYQLTLTSHIR